MDNTEELTPAQKLGYGVGDWFEVVDVSVINGSINQKIHMGLLVKLVLDNGSSTALFETDCGDYLYIHLSRLKPLNNKEQAKMNNGEVLYTKEQIILAGNYLGWSGSYTNQVIDALDKISDPEYIKYVELKNKFEG